MGACVPHCIRRQAAAEIIKARPLTESNKEEVDERVTHYRKFLHVLSDTLYLVMYEFADEILRSNRDSNTFDAVHLNRVFSRITRLIQEVTEAMKFLMIIYAFLYLLKASSMEHPLI